MYLISGNRKDGSRYREEVRNLAQFTLLLERIREARNRTQSRSSGPFRD